MGTLDEKRGCIYVPSGKVNAFQEAILSGIFDCQTNDDVKEILKEMEEYTLFKRHAIIKTLLFPQEVTLEACVMATGKPKHRNNGCVILKSGLGYSLHRESKPV